MIVAVSQGVALLGLFVLLPFAVGACVMALISWRGPAPAPGTRTSELLAAGQPASAEILALRSMGNFLDVRPMVRFRLRVTPQDGADFELTVVQAVPRRRVSELVPGTTLQVRVSSDHSAGAVLLP